MSDLVAMLDKMGQSPVLEEEQMQWLTSLAQAAHLPTEQIAAMQQQQLEQLLTQVQLHSNGCFMIVAPDTPDEPDQDDEDQPEQTPRH